MHLYAHTYNVQVESSSVVPYIIQILWQWMANPWQQHHFFAISTMVLHTPLTPKQPKDQWTILTLPAPWWETYSLVWTWKPWESPCHTQPKFISVCWRMWCFTNTVVYTEMGYGYVRHKSHSLSMYTRILCHTTLHVTAVKGFCACSKLLAYASMCVIYYAYAIIH